ncbi:class A beta-lactamase [Mycobacterium sp. MYCO198283]|uniref:class A beta-lactamase n=1 Tax=Mycobacterium sp. MYCO198283 TaxID=2883505 RepID=UPI0035ABD3A5
MRLTRRTVLLGAVAVGVLAADPPAAAAPPAADPDIAACEDRYGARIGVWARDLASPATLAHRSDETFAVCSTFKVYAAARVLQLGLDLATPVPIAASEIVANSPVTSTRVGSTMTLAEVCEAALTLSDNAAGNALLRTVGGPPAITAFARAIGDDRTRLDRWETALNEALPGDPRDTTSPRALSTGCERLLVGDALDPAARDRLAGWMRATQTSGTRFRAALPPGWTSADKTGAGDYGSTNDAGLLIGPAGERVALAVLARSRDDRRDAGPYNDAIADTVRIVLGRFGHR